MDFFLDYKCTQSVPIRNKQIGLLDFPACFL